MDDSSGRSGEAGRGMIIPIDDDYRLKSDRNQWMIQRKKLVSEEIRWESFKFFHDPSNAVTALVQMRIRESDADTLTDALAEVDRVTAHVLHALAPHFEVKAMRGAP